MFQKLRNLSPAKVSEWGKQAINSQREKLEKAFPQSHKIIVEGICLTGEVVLVLGALQVFTAAFINFTFCIGPSMIPTINETGDLVLIDNFSYWILRKDYKSGDVIIASNPNNPSKTVCKRIAATAGEVILITKDFSSKRAGTSSYGITITKPRQISSCEQKELVMELSRNIPSNTGMSGSGPSRSSSSSGTQCSAEENSENKLVKNSADQHDVVDNNALTNVKANVRSLGEKEESPQPHVKEGIMIVADQKSDYEMARQNDMNRRRAGYYGHQKSITEPYVIPPGHVWLAGDNIFNSTDSRYYGPVPISMLKGRVFLKILPRPPFIETVESSTDILYGTDIKSDVSFSSGTVSLADAITKRVLEIENSRDLKKAASDPAVSEVTAADTTQSSKPPNRSS